jgi:hypothetical protein
MSYFQPLDSKGAEKVEPLGIGLIFGSQKNVLITRLPRKLERMEIFADHRAARDDHPLAKTRFQAVLAVEIKEETRRATQNRS